MRVQQTINLTPGWSWSWSWSGGGVTFRHYSMFVSGTQLPGPGTQGTDQLQSTCPCFLRSSATHLGHQINTWIISGFSGSGMAVLVWWTYEWLQNWSWWSHPWYWSGVSKPLRDKNIAIWQWSSGLLWCCLVSPLSTVCVQINPGHKMCDTLLGQQGLDWAGLGCGLAGGDKLADDKWGLPPHRSLHWAHCGHWASWKLRLWWINM